jgi:uncharacterized protein YciI
MYALAIIRYRRPLDEVVAVQDAHRSYMAELKATGTLVASGPLVPRYGGALLLRVDDAGADAALERVRDGDPYVRAGVAQYELLPWNPTTGRAELDRAAGDPPQDVPAF